MEVPRTAIVTASYAGDFGRCRLLCETVDAMVTGHAHHYLLVAPHDVVLFRELESPGRTVVDERDILPAWLRAYRDPLSLFRRHVWYAPFIKPLRGWHVQQLRRMAIARHLTENAFFYVDSDVAFVRPFDCGSLWQGARLRLYRKDNGLAEAGLEEHRIWWLNAGRLLGIGSDVKGQAAHDYISTLVAWRRDTLAGVLDRIEQVSGRSWVETMAQDRRFSECLIYGRHADEVAGAPLHFHDSRNLCAVRWTEPLRDNGAIVHMLESLDPYQVAIGIQSFLGVTPQALRACIAEWRQQGRLTPASAQDEAPHASAPATAQTGRRRARSAKG